MKTILLILGLGLALGTRPVQAQSDLSQDQVAAYVTLVKADRARNRGEVNEALAGYRQAQQAFRAIAQKDPRWQPEVVKYRLAYCENEIEKLDRPGTAVPPAAAVAASAAENTAAVVSETTTQVPALQPPAEPDPALQAELATLRQQVTRLQGLSALTGEVARLQQEQAGWEAERKRLEQELEDGQAALQQARSEQAPDEEVVRLEKENTKLRDQVADLEKDLEKARETKVSAKELKKMQNELADLKDERERLNEQLKEARSAADRPSPEQERLTDQLRETEEKLAALSAEKKQGDADLKAMQELAESRFQEMTSTAQRLEAALQQVSELAQEKERLAQTSASDQAAADEAARWQSERTAALEARAALEQKVAALESEVQQLKTLAATPAAASTGSRDLADLQKEVGALGEELRLAGLRLDETRDNVLKALKQPASAR